MIEASAAAVTHHTEYFRGVRRKLNWYLQLIFIRKYVLKRLHPGLPETEEFGVKIFKHARFIAPGHHRSTLRKVCEPAQSGNQEFWLGEFC